jgi:hypothetical protein
MTELFIENNAVDISPEISMLLTYVIDDVKDFAAKNTTVSKTVVLPGTKRNNALFGSIFEVSGANSYDPLKPNIGLNFNAAISAKMLLVQDNIQAVKGIVQMLRVIDDNGFIEYEVGLFGELSGFVAKMGNKKLEDLDFSAYDSVYSIANIVASWDNAAGGSGLYYPLIDYGTYSSAKKNWAYLTFKPSLFAKEYIDKIFAATGYTYECALFGSTRFKSIIVPHNRKTFQKVVSDIFNKSDVHEIFNSGAVVLATMNIGSNGGFTTIDNRTFTYSGTGILVDISAVFHLHAYTGTSTLQYGIIKNGTYITATSGSDPTFDYPLQSLSISLTTGDTIAFAVDNIDVLEQVEFSVEANIVSTAAIAVNVLLGDSFAASEVIPKNILQKEFISSILKLFNCYLFEDANEDKLLKIEPFIDFYADAPVLDWTLKVDRAKPKTITPMSELNSRYFEFNYKKDTDYFNDLYEKRYNQTYGSYLYDSQYEFAKETTKIELIFSGTPLVGYTGEDKIYSTIYKKSGNTEETIDSNIRLLQAKKITGVTSWDILDAAGTSVLGSYTNYGYAGHLNDPDAPSNDLSFGVPKELFFTLVTGALNVNQFNVYWSSYMAEITDKDSRLMAVNMRLNMLDIYNLSFKNLIMIDGVLFRLNKILDYNVNVEDTCKVELLKLINRLY